MPEYRYEFELLLVGHGPNRDEAWENAVESFAQDPGETPPVVLREVYDADVDPDEPEDTTPIQGNKLRELVEMIARMKTKEEADDDNFDAVFIEALVDDLIESARDLTGIKGPEQEPENVSCQTCGKQIDPLHYNRQCPDCFIDRPEKERCDCKECNHPHFHCKYHGIHGEVDCPGCEEKKT